MHFFYLSCRGEDCTFPALPSDFSWPGSLNVILARMVYSAVSQRTCTIAHPPTPVYTKEMFRYILMLLLFIFFIVLFLSKEPVGDTLLEGP